MDPVTGEGVQLDAVEPAMPGSSDDAVGHRTADSGQRGPERSDPVVEDGEGAEATGDGAAGPAPGDPSASEGPGSDGDAMEQRWERLQSSFLERAQFYEDLVRSLQNQIERLQEDQFRTLLKPVFERLANLHAQAVEAAGDTSDSAASTDFRFFAESIEELLDVLDVVSVGAEVRTPFRPRFHHAVRTVPTDDEALDGMIQRVVRQGFVFAGTERPLLPARVAVYRHSRADSTPTDTDQ